MDAIKKWIENRLLEMDVNIENTSNILIGNWFDESSSWHQFATAMHTVIMPIALTIITICFLIEFLKITIQMDILKWEYGLKCFFKLVFAKVCIDLSTYLLDAIYATAAEWISTTSTLTFGSSTSYKLGETTWLQIKAQVMAAKTLETLAIFISVGILFLAINAVMIVVQVMAYARQFEICILCAMAPLPCAFLPLEDGGMARIPKKYFMTFASACLSGLFMIMSIRLYQLLASVIISQIASGSDVGSAVGSLLLASLVLVMAVVKSGSWAQKILDVG